jgi:hypothetical protein
MKHKRQMDLCKQGLVYMQPVKGVMFCPVDPGAAHPPEFDALLLKATDFLIESLDDSGSLSVEFQSSVSQVISSSCVIASLVLHSYCVWLGTRQ